MSATRKVISSDADIMPFLQEVIGNRTTHRIAIASCLIELLGVLVVGVLSFTHPEVFRAPSVWSGFGIGYGFIPLVLPVVGLWWLARVDRRVRG